MSKSYCRYLKVAAIQLNSTLDRDYNLSRCEAYLKEAVKRGAEVCVLPELFSCLGPEQECYSRSEKLRGSLWEWGSGLAEKLGCFLVMGSFLECGKKSRRSAKPSETGSDDYSSSSDGDSECLACVDDKAAFDPNVLAALKAKKPLPYNTCCVFDNLGRHLGSYRKIHLFDCQLQETYCKESGATKPGSKTTVCKIDNSWVLGVGICYDLRFPEQFRDMRRQGANIFVIPSAFTMETGREHWEVLLRARAIENQAYVIAANQCGSSGVRRYGHSMIVDPWGTVIAQAGERPDIVMGELDAEWLMHVRQRLPQE